jgi:hypothetical protein
MIHGPEDFNHGDYYEDGYGKAYETKADLELDEDARLDVHEDRCGADVDDEDNEGEEVGERGTI